MPEEASVARPLERRLEDSMVVLRRADNRKQVEGISGVNGNENASGKPNFDYAWRSRSWVMMA